VSEEQMVALFGLGLHPDAEALMAEYRSEHIAAGMKDRQLAGVNATARSAVSLGRPFPEYRDLGPFEERVAARLEVVRRECGREPTGVEERKVRWEEARRQRRAVAGFDLVFTPVSSVSRLWGLDPRAWVREAIEQAHYAARDAALRLLEEHAAHTRTGSSGQAQIETCGLIAAVFDHADNRLGEPNLHSHVAVSSKVLGVDGVWRALDARGLYRITVAASELYNTRIEHELHTRLGLEFEARPDTAGKREPVREIKGFAPSVLAHFTRRRADIEAEYERLVSGFRAEHGRDPSVPAAKALAQQATLATRKGKKPPRAWSAMREEWRTELVAVFGSDALVKVMAVVPERWEAGASAGVISTQVDVGKVAARLVAEVQEHHATWTRWSLVAQAQRELRGVWFANAGEQERAVEMVVEAALSAWSLPVEPPDLVAEPTTLRRSDGCSVFAQHGAARYTSQALLDAEARLVDAGKYATTVGVDGWTAEIALADHELRSGRVLDPGQRALVRTFACDGRLLLAGIGPAGAGKTTAMKALADVLRTGGTGRLVPLATSASAAAVLAGELGVSAENLHKFLWEWTQGQHAEALVEGNDVPTEAASFALGPGDVVLVDEAGMAGTLNLDRLVSIAAQRGAVVRLLGDYRQLGAVESGGALRLIAQETCAVELSTLYRFADPAEAAATLKIRTGDTSGLDFYERAGRIQHGSRQSMTEVAYDGWKADMLAGRTALMAAATNADVAELCARARADRVAVGQVESGGARLHDGNLVGVGDWVVTRANERRLRAGTRDFVKNGDAWRVVRRRADGALLVEHLEHRGRLLLPSAYVAANVELLYATTAHRAQGSTVDTCHALITEEMGRENLYVTASRARHGTVLYVATHEVASVDEDEHVDTVRFDADAYAAREILEHVVARETAELSATEQIRAAHAQAESLATLVPRYLHALDIATEVHYRAIVEQTLPDLAGELRADPAWHAVVRALRDADTAGWDAAALLTSVSRRDLATAESLAQVISWRLHQVIDHERSSAAVLEPTSAAADRYRVLLNEIAPQLAANVDTAATLTLPAMRTNPSECRGSDHLRVLHQALGTIRVNRARNEAAWPALLLALRRVEYLGLDVADVLDAALDRRRLRSAASVSQTLALDIHRYLEVGSDPAGAHPQIVWPSILRSLARLEAAGTDPAGALTEAIGADAGPSDQDTLATLARRLQAAVRRLDDRQLPSWLRGARHVDDPTWRPYLDARAELMRRRIETLVRCAVAERPAWIRSLGCPPTDPDERDQWMRHLSVIAAYRDQYQVAGDDADHPLGPYPERGRTGHDAYWIAADSLLALWGARAQGDAGWSRFAADLFRTLDASEQARIASELVRQLGPDWLGDARDPVPDADQAVYRDRLADVLVEHGHLRGPAADVGDSAGRNSSACARPTPRWHGRRGEVRPRSASPAVVESVTPARSPRPLVQRPPQPGPDQSRAPRLDR
jgi:conjugative relaxase-like TrwC/TraI family protein